MILREPRTTQHNPDSRPVTVHGGYCTIKNYGPVPDDSSVTFEFDIEFASKWPDIIASSLRTSLNYRDSYSSIRTRRQGWKDQSKPTPDIDTFIYFLFLKSDFRGSIPHGVATRYRAVATNYQTRLSHPSSAHDVVLLHPARPPTYQDNLVTPY
jgi:hypothetical protein